MCVYINSIWARNPCVFSPLNTKHPAETQWSWWSPHLAPAGSPPDD